MQITRDHPVVAAPASRWRTALAHFLVLTKARLSALVLLTTAVGFVQGAAVDATSAQGAFVTTTTWVWLQTFVGTLLGTAMVAGAANAFNQILEIRRDALMHRTQGRPLPIGAIRPGTAIAIAVGLTVVGTVLLATMANTTAAGLAVLTLLVYVLLYTPLKVRTTLNTLVGAVCGAIPPMIGWVAGSGRLDAGAWALAGLLFIWQIPHFLALAWLYREDYERGRYQMLPARDANGEMTAQIVILTSLMLIPMALSATLLGLAGWFYTIGSIALGVWLIARGVRLYVERTHDNARRVFLGSLLYLSVVLVLLVLDRGPISGENPVHQLAQGPAALPAIID